MSASVASCRSLRAFRGPDCGLLEHVGTNCGCLGKLSIRLFVCAGLLLDKIWITGRPDESWRIMLLAHIICLSPQFVTLLWAIVWPFNPAEGPSTFWCAFANHWWETKWESAIVDCPFPKEVATPITLLSPCLHCLHCPPPINSPYLHCLPWLISCLNLALMV